MEVDQLRSSASNYSHLMGCFGPTGGSVHIPAPPQVEDSLWDNMHHRWCRSALIVTVNLNIEIYRIQVSVSLELNLKT